MMNLNNFEIYFVGKRVSRINNGSFKMRGVEMKNIFEQNYNLTNIHLIKKEEIYTLNKTHIPKLFIFVKPRKCFHEITHIKNVLNGIVLIDFIDTLSIKIMIKKMRKRPQLVDGVILPNIDAKNYYEDTTQNNNNLLLYHHASVPQKTEKTQNIDFCYCGERRTFIRFSEDVNNYKFSEQNLELVSCYNCHTSYRIPNKKFKPNTKISLAANCNSNILINKSSGGVETLPPEYTYICEDNKKSFLYMISFIKEDFESKNWFENLKIMEWYKEKYSLEKISREYYDYILKVVDEKSSTT